MEILKRLINMELSTEKTKEAKKLGVSVSELVFADLLSLGYMKNDAFAIAYPELMGMNIQNLNAERDKILSRPSFQNFCDERRRVNASKLEFSGNASDMELIDNEMTAKEILKIARQMPENSKERGEMFMKYADLTRKNDQKTEEMTEAINFYFPIKCHQCPLLIAYNDFMKQKKKTKEELRPVEMEGIIREAKPIIEKARKKTEK